MKLICFNKLVFLFALIFGVFIFELNIGFTQTASSNTKPENNNQYLAENNIIANETNDLEITSAVFIKNDNSSAIDPQEEIIRRKAMTMIMDTSKSSNPLTNIQSASTFFLIEQKQKDRNKSKLEMQSYNQKNDKKIKENFQRFQKKRYQQVSYTGKHYDYTSYNQNFQGNRSR